MPSRRELANAIRALSMDAVQKANSGHPGAPMGMADIAEVLWNDYFKHNPANPKWPDRDRFVLSNGHGSMLIYSLLHLTGYDLPIEELKNFRQLHSKTPGHPEYGYTPGVETTTGPLGQGLTNAVGMALAEKVLAGQFNRGNFKVVDHHTYVFLGDGCMMEGISHEACSLAGTMKLGKLIAFYDDNGISIDGEVHGWFTDNTPKRFEAYGWHVIPKVDGHDSAQIKAAIEKARSVTDKPTLICCQTIIGWGAPNKAGSEKCHGEALGVDEIAATRKNLGWNHEPFVVPADHYDGWSAKTKGANTEAAWKKAFEDYRKAHPDLAAEFERRMAGKLPVDWDTKAAAYVKSVIDKGESIPSRNASRNALNGFGPLLPELIGGSADLAGSNYTIWAGSKDVNHADSNGNYIYFGVREFAMSAMLNGITLHGGFVPYGATFLMFSEYARNAVRMAALMKIQSIFVYTHDSIGLGEDGPTHQGVEQTATLRMIPRMDVWRPCDAVESVIAWKAAIEKRNGPCCLLFSRQALAHQTRNETQVKNIARGGYTLVDAGGTPDIILIATGSEVDLAVQAAKQVSDKKIRVVSMPCTSIFDAQDAAYRESVLPIAVRKRIAVEAGVSDGWRKYVGLDGKILGVDTFGESAPFKKVFEHFGLTVDNLVKIIKSLG